MSASELTETPLWLHGPEWLHNREELREESTLVQSVPEECKCEMRQSDAAHLLVNVQVSSTFGLRQVIDPEWYSSVYCLFRVKGLVLSFIRRLRGCSGSSVPDTPSPTE